MRKYKHATTQLYYNKLYPKSIIAKFVFQTSTH